MLVADETEVADPLLRLAEDGRLRELMEAVQTHHVQPPTRQQMIFDVIESFAKHLKTPVPAGFSVQLSAESNVDRLYAMMQDELTRTKAIALSHKEFDHVALNAVADATNGGLAVVRQKDRNVNEQLAANRYVGVGIQVGTHPVTKELMIHGVIEGGTAAEAGVKENDVFEAVDGRPTKDVPLNQIVDWLRGPEGTTVKVTVRNGDGSREIEIVRRVTPFKTVHVVSNVNIPDTILLRPDRISASTVHEMTTAVAQASEKVTNVVIDLRSVTSGSIHHLNLLADALADEGTAGFVETRTSRRELKTEPGTFADDKTIVLLYIPGRSSRIDWLASVSAAGNVKVYYELHGPSSPFLGPPEATPGTLDSFPIWKGSHFIELNASRFLLPDGTAASDAEPFGNEITVLDDRMSTMNGVITSLKSLAGLELGTNGDVDIEQLGRSAYFQMYNDDQALLRLISKKMASR